jgi:curved DNA-binding protein CbpA
LAAADDNQAMTSAVKDYYALLHVHPDAPIEIIRASYRTLMQRLKAHPDLGGDHAAAARINAAYAVLKNPARRAAYDAELAHRATAGEARAASGATAPDRHDRNFGTGREAAKATRSGDPAVEACAFCGQAVPWRPQADIGIALCSRCSSPLARVQLAERQDGDPKRALYRIGKHEPVRIYMDWQDRVGQRGSLLDVSLTGLRFAAQIELDAGRKVRIDSGVCAAVARVAHRNWDDGTRAWQFGAEFLTVAFKRQRGSLLSVGA